MINPIQELIKKRQRGILCGIASYCTANKIAIEAILEQAQRFESEVLIEATANQVNQYGGYTGMQPGDFRDFVYQIANEVGFPVEKIILGGDHLGPLVWAKEAEEAAMNKALTLVKLFAKAGYKKIHLDTSMRLGDDKTDEMLSEEVIAKRGVLLYQACEEVYKELLAVNPHEMEITYVIGSEVPIPGGTQSQEEYISVTSPRALKQTLQVYNQEFQKAGYSKMPENIVAVVVQPGVEFGDDEIFHYDRTKALQLCEVAKENKDIILEGHSTDYQSPQNLKEMVEDEIAILKVGPALTFGLREGLFALSAIEKELIDENERVNFETLLESVMLKGPENWTSHYHGTKRELEIKRKYSLSDRCRYYMGEAEIEKGMEQLFDNLNAVDIPMSLLHQHMPNQYLKVREGKLDKEARNLVKDFVALVTEDYNYAIKHNYMINGIFV